MSRTMMKRLEKLKTATGPKVLGYSHIIYERSPEDFEAQKSELIRSGRAKPDDFFFDWNFNLPPEQQEFRASETIPVTRTHEEWVDILAQEEGAQ